jgi:large subunit ribosomal protein L15
MKLHDLRPADGARRARTRVGRGIAAGKGKTAGRGTKGQKARAGGSIPAWFEGGQTPLHMRIPKLRGFTNRLKVDYEVVNVGAIAQLVELGQLEAGEMPGAKTTSKSPAPITVNQDILRAAGLVRTLAKPLKVLGAGELSTALFVVADRFSKSAIVKIEAAGGSVSILEIPKEPRPAIGVDRGAGAATEAKPAKKKRPADDDDEETAAAAEPEGSVAASQPERGSEEPRAPKPKRAPKAARPAAGSATAADDGAAPADEAAPAGDG